MDSLSRLIVVIFSICLVLAFACENDDDDEEERAGNQKDECIAQCWVQYDTDENQCSLSSLGCFDTCDEYQVECKSDCSAKYDEESEEWADCTAKCQDEYYDCFGTCNEIYSECIETAEKNQADCEEVCEDTY